MIGTFGRLRGQSSQVATGPRPRATCFPKICGSTKLDHKLVAVQALKIVHFPSTQHHCTMVMQATGPMTAKESNTLGGSAAQQSKIIFLKQHRNLEHSGVLRATKKLSSLSCLDCAKAMSDRTKEVKAHCSNHPLPSEGSKPPLQSHTIIRESLSQNAQSDQMLKMH